MWHNFSTAQDPLYEYLLFHFQKWARAQVLQIRNRFLVVPIVFRVSSSCIYALLVLEFFYWFVSIVCIGNFSRIHLNGIDFNLENFLGWNKILLRPHPIRFSNHCVGCVCQCHSVSFVAFHSSLFWKNVMKYASNDILPIVTNSSSLSVTVMTVGIDSLCPKG